MTSETRIMVNLSDMQAIDLRCKACGGSVGINPTWRKVHLIPISCPTCGEPWMSDKSPTHDAISEFLQAIKTILEKEETFKFDVRVSVPERASGRASGEKD